MSPPPQLALAVSLIGNENPRGLAGRGRFYLPPMTGMQSVTDDGKIGPLSISPVVSATQKLIRDVNALFNGLGVQYAYVGNTSSGSGNRPGRQQVVSELRGDVGKMSIDLAEKLVGESLGDTAKQSATVDRFLAEIDSSK